MTEPSSVAQAVLEPMIISGLNILNTGITTVALPTHLRTINIEIQAHEGSEIEAYMK